MAALVPSLTKDRLTRSAQFLSSIPLLGLCIVGILISAGEWDAAIYCLRPVLILIIGVAGWIVFPVVARLVLPQPILTVSNDKLRTGEDFILNFQQTFKRTTNVKLIAVQVVLRDETWTRDGENDLFLSRHDKVIHEIKYPARRFGAREVFSDRYQIQVPLDAVPTLMDKQDMFRHLFWPRDTHSKLWLVRVAVRIEGWPVYQEEYQGIQVLSEDPAR